jgi:3-hydroxyacyl-[acyl-carrier-protein] dehydratase
MTIPIEPAASPLRQWPQLVEHSDTDLRAVLTVDPDEPVLAGHYPGRPILPGVCLIEAMHRAVCLFANNSAIRLDLTGVRSGRFRRPVLPPARLELTATVTRQAGRWTVQGTATTATTRVADLVLEYEARPR